MASLRTIVACALALAAAAATGESHAEGPTILSPYRDLVMPGGAARAGAHPAVDFGGKIGDPVLAAADGFVYGARSGGLCGNGIRLAHPPFNRYTLYCQLHTVGVKKGDAVKRGQVIGTLGASGEPTMRAKIYGIAIPMLHFMLSERPERRVDGQIERTFDPLQFIVGCFDPAKRYPDDHLVLTYPLKCN
jgi:murein DD-endopeptidase MepM/ murein hydrolase activator NlpD